MTGQIEAWKSLEKKVNAFNDKYPGSGVICIALVSNVMVNAGSDEMIRKFTDKQEVQNLYKEAFLQLTGTANLHIAEEVADETDVNTLLYTHVYDMDVGIMRALISNAAAPPDAISNKDSRRNWYKPENCPVWWQETGLAFKSVNQTEGKKEIKKMQLMALVESLQNFQQIQPKVPQRTNRTGYVSRFQCEIEGVAEEVGGISADEVEVEVEVASAEEVEDGGFSTVEVDYVNCCLYKIVKPTEHTLVPDIYLPEVLLKIIQEKEEVNRLLAEIVLKQKTDC